jgi:hypothetical protein
VSAIVVALIALVPPALYLGQNIPIATEAVVIPTWFRTVAPHIGKHQVLLVFPAPFSVMQPAPAWQAIEGMPYALVGLTPQEVTRGSLVINAASFSFGAVQTVSAHDIASVRSRLRAWGVTMIVIPDQPGLPAYDRIPSVTIAAALITAATRELPIHQADAWVWTDVNHSGSAIGVSAQRFAFCTTGMATQGSPAVKHATSCVLVPSP